MTGKILPARYWVDVIYQLWRLTGHSSRLKVRAAHSRPDFGMLRSIVSLAKNGVGQLLISTTSWVGLFKILAVEDDEGVTVQGQGA